MQTPLYFLPKDAGIKIAAYADAGSLWDYRGPTSWAATGETLSGSICAAPPCPLDNAMHIRSSVGVGVIWDSPFGPLRIDFAYPLLKQITPSDFALAAEPNSDSGADFWSDTRSSNGSLDDRQCEVTSVVRSDRGSAGRVGAFRLATSMRPALPFPDPN